ncbi:SH3 domain-containing protein [Cohnella sp. GCM10027633]|uniref:C40 family peptidase n=1 Tax=unclassified Cohnella TaxID=2636738 RepID=UPI0036280F42
MRKVLLIVLTVLTMLTAVPAFAGAATSGSKAAIVASVSFRTAPNTSSTVIRYLKAGETVTIVETVNAYWYKVKDGSGNTGYISSNEKYAKVTEEAAPGGNTGGAGNAIILNSVSFRNAPSTDGARIRYLQKNEQVTVTSKVNAYWFAVTDSKGVAGYVSTSDQYVKLTGSVPTSPTQPTGPSQPGTPSGPQQIEAVVAAGLKYLGTPYEYGSDRNTTKTFDCSDFVRQAFKDALGATLPADSSQQGAYVRKLGSVTTDWHSLKRGDLMFFMSYKGTKASSYAGKSPFGESINHVGIYLGNGQVLHTYSKESGGVRVDGIEGKHWEYRFLFGGSAL